MREFSFAESAIGEVVKVVLCEVAAGKEVLIVVDLRLIVNLLY